MVVETINNLVIIIQGIIYLVHSTIDSVININLPFKDIYLFSNLIFKISK